MRVARVELAQCLDTCSTDRPGSPTPAHPLDGQATGPGDQQGWRVLISRLRFWRPMSVPLDHTPPGSVRERTVALRLLSSLAQHEIELVPGPEPLTARHERTVSQSPWPDSNWRAASCNRVPEPLGHRGRGRERRASESNAVRCHPVPFSRRVWSPCQSPSFAEDPRFELGEVSPSSPVSNRCAVAMRPSSWHAEDALVPYRVDELDERRQKRMDGRYHGAPGRTRTLTSPGRSRVHLRLCDRGFAPRPGFEPGPTGVTVRRSAN